MRLVALVLVILAAPALAADPPEPSKTTHAQLKCDGEFVPYAATAGRMLLKDRDGKERAWIFHIAYLKTGVTDPATRPITFAFNGGPGSSSVWLHMGGLGPRLVDMGPEGLTRKPPYAAIENEHSWLGFTDFVFIDPVSTGYSRPAKGRKKSEFHGLDEDAGSVADFIRQWLTANKRWGSPVYLVGESYGTTRAAELSGQLQGRGVEVSGIVLVSPVLNFQTTAETSGNDLAYWLHLPTLAATARFHGKVETRSTLPAFLDDVEKFAETDYLTALAKGDRLTREQRDAVATKIAGYIGVSKDYVLRSNLRVNSTAFRKELLRDRLRTVGRLDSRFVGIDRKAVGGHPESDPSMEAIRGPFTAALNDYLARTLRYESDLNYEIFGSVHPWSYRRHQNRYVNVAETLRRTMNGNANLRVLMALGYYDLATPYYAAEYTVTHMLLPPERRKNISFAWYESGHMMYIRRADRIKLKADAAAFYAGVDQGD